MNTLLHTPEYYDDHADRGTFSARRSMAAAMVAQRAMPVARFVSSSKRNLAIAEPYFFNNTHLFHVFAASRHSSREEYTRYLTADQYGIRPSGSDIEVVCNEKEREVMLAMYRPTFGMGRERVMLVADTMQAGRTPANVKVFEQVLNAEGTPVSTNRLQLSECSLADQAKLYALGNKIIDTMVSAVECGENGGDPLITARLY